MNPIIEYETNTNKNANNNNNNEHIENSEINDVRLPNQLKGITFSNFKKTQVCSQLIDCMKKSKIEPACYWAAELVCSGHYSDIWETAIHYIGKHIHLGNPKIIVYIERRYQIFKNIITTSLAYTELQLRNNSNLRRLFAEMVYILATSNRKHSFEPIKINRVEEFDMTHMTERLKATSVTFAQDCFLMKDPRELYIPANEFAFNISAGTKNTVTACYWIEWMIEFDIICRKKKEPCLIIQRNYPVDLKFKHDPIWLVWDILKHYCNKLHNVFISSILDSLINVFCIKYTHATGKRRRYLLYYAVALITEPVNPNIELVSDKITLQTIVDKIDKVYAQIKKNEESPGTDYLFSNLDNSNSIEKTMKQLETMNKMNGIL